MRKYTGANWNNPDDSYTRTFLEMNQQNFWLPEEVAISGDIKYWVMLSEREKDAYAKNLAVLTFLDTWQGDMGMNVVSRALDSEQHQKKALVSFMQAVENSIHSKSYDSIFSTLLNTKDIDDLFIWCENNESMQSMLRAIVSNYRELEKRVYLNEYTDTEVTEDELNEYRYKAMVSSVFLESALFYTGFYYPLWFAGQGRLTGSGEIISLIIRDENVHGLYIGMLANEILLTFEEEKQEELKQWVIDLLEKLYKLEVQLIEDIYTEVNLVHDVKVFLRYNFNKALMNLGLEQYFETEEVNPVVLRGIDVGNKQIDYFSQKGDSYSKRKLEELQDSDFDLEGIERIT